MNSLISHLCNQVNTSNGVLMRQRTALGIVLTYPQWLDCIAYVFAIGDGEAVTAYCMGKPELQAVLREAWGFYNSVD